MTLGSRVAVMRDGYLQQVAPPMELYRHPANKFVGEFVGSPAMNFLTAEVQPDGTALVSGARIPAAGAKKEVASRRMILGVRPHDISIVASGTGDFDAWVDVVEPRGSELLIYLRLGQDRSGQELRVVAPPELSIEAERVVGVVLDRERLHWFESEK